jgi:hypothetical protein
LGPSPLPRRISEEKERARSRSRQHLQQREAAVVRNLSMRSVWSSLPRGAPTRRHRLFARCLPAFQRSKVNDFQRRPLFETGSTRSDRISQITSTRSLPPSFRGGVYSPIVASSPNDGTTILAKGVHADQPASFVLVVVEGQDAGKSFEIDAEKACRILVGQSVACEHQLTDRLVSRRHFAIEPNG